MALPATAQSAVGVRASLPITDQFPQISLFIAVVDGTGRYIPDLLAPSFTVIEDNNPIPDLTIQEMQVGTDFFFFEPATSTVDWSFWDLLMREIEFFMRFFYY